MQVWEYINMGLGRKAGPPSQCPATGPASSRARLRSRSKARTLVLGPAWVPLSRAKDRWTIAMYARRANPQPWDLWSDLQPLQPGAPYAPCAPVLQYALDVSRPASTECPSSPPRSALPAVASDRSHSCLCRVFKLMEAVSGRYVLSLCGVRGCCVSG